MTTFDVSMFGCIGYHPQEQYLANSYHNSIHAADVTQTANVLLKARRPEDSS